MQQPGRASAQYGIIRKDVCQATGIATVCHEAVWYEDFMTCRLCAGVSDILYTAEQYFAAGGKHEREHKEKKTA